jgi:tRNA(Ile)-lysidine synthetase-like protein
LVLAVSGGIDSMTMLHATARAIERGTCGSASLVVATFDHGTGEHATRAAALVQRVAADLGLACVAGRSDDLLAGEAAWRAARWSFLRRVARERAGEVATAHTRDDQVETIVMRLLRGAGARGISALRAPSPVRRPLLDIARAEIERYASDVGLEWIDDPSNADRAHLRNRVRLDLLPALRSHAPNLEGDLLQLAIEAATLRARCTAVVRPLVSEASAGRVVTRFAMDAAWTDDAAALCCQTIAELAGLALDWRGTARLARFAREGTPGKKIPLSGGWEAVRRVGGLEIRKTAPATPPLVALNSGAMTTFGSWCFRAVEGGQRELPSTAAARIASSEPGSAEADADPWSAWLPADTSLEVRSWRDGDRMLSSGSGLRRVKRFLSDSRVAAADRAGWPVVIADGEIVWIPGVCCARAATARPGRPRVHVVCERVHS